jgi:ABC-2 type transport system ATP-binding protein
MHDETMSETRQPIIEVKSLLKHYDNVTAVDDISFKIKPGICFGMLGPNGAGKTTTIEMMEGITTPSSGEILYKNKPIGKTFRNECGIQFQHTALQDFLTVKETLELFQKFYPQSEDIATLVERCKLDEFIKNNNQQLSGGQRQRMLLAIALINKPEIVFLDEPTTGLDPQARHNFWELIKDVLNRGTTVILSTHYMEEAAQLCDEIIIMDHGHIISQGAPDKLLHQHFSERLVRFPESILSPALINQLKLKQKLIQHESWIEISTADVNQTLKILLDMDINLNQIQVRQRNLEDLFLELTGRELRL